MRERMSLIGILILSLILRLWNLGSPKGFVFDEVYYVDGARDYLAHLVEMDKAQAEFVVHPPLGKWLIAAGIKIFGDREFGWRISAALIGTLSIYLIYRISRDLFSSEFLALSAALLTGLDGLHLVMSRTALLDIFLMFFTLLSFWFFLRKNNWLLGISLAAACAVKWSGIYFALIFIALAVLRDFRTHKKLSLVWIPQFILIPPLVYLSTWWGWFITHTGWDRNISSNPLISLWKYHREMLNFHTGLIQAHSYSAHPWSWLILGRPTSFFYESPTCASQSCSQEILALGTPFLWWAGTLAIFITVGYTISRRDKKGMLILSGIVAGYLPWFAFQKRTVFSFYSIVFEPFLILAIVYCLSIFVDSRSMSAPQITVYKQRLRAVYGLYLAIGLCFLYFLPIYLGQIIPYDQWHARMWFPSWI